MLKVKYFENMFNICNQGGKISAWSILPLLLGQDIDKLSIYLPIKKMTADNLNNLLAQSEIEYVFENNENLLNEELYYTLNDKDELIIANNFTKEEILTHQLQIIKELFTAALTPSVPKTEFEEGIELISKGLSYFENMKKRNENLDFIEQGIAKLSSN